MIKKKTTPKKSKKKVSPKEEKFIASTFTGLLKPEITIDKYGITVKTPRLFGGKENSIPFNRLSSVNINHSVMDDSTINIITLSETRPISVYGFKKNIAEKIKKIIVSKIKRAK